MIMNLKRISDEEDRTREDIAWLARQGRSLGRVHTSL